MAGSTAAAATDPARFERVLQSLSRYPDVDEAERRELILFLKKAPALDNALLKSIPEMQPKLAQLKQDHPKEFGVGPGHFAFGLLLLVLFVALVFFLWDAGV